MLSEYEIDRAPSHGGGRIRVQGEPVGDFLAVRQEPEDATAYSKRGWAIDHRPTGLRVTTLATKEAALAVAETIAARADWSFADGDQVKAVVPEDVRNYIVMYRGASEVAPFGEPPPPPPVAPPHRISVTVTFEIQMGVADMWPDYDWPEVIDAAAVRKVIDDEYSGDAESLIRDWCFGDGDIDVSVWTPKPRTTP